MKYSDYFLLTFFVFFASLASCQSNKKGNLYKEKVNYIIKEGGYNLELNEDDLNRSFPDVDFLEDKEFNFIQDSIAALDDFYYRSFNNSFSKSEIDMLYNSLKRHIDKTPLHFLEDTSTQKNSNNEKDKESSNVNSAKRIKKRTDAILKKALDKRKWFFEEFQRLDFINYERAIIQRGFVSSLKVYPTNKEDGFYRVKNKSEDAYRALDLSEIKIDDKPIIKLKRLEKVEMFSEKYAYGYGVNLTLDKKGTKKLKDFTKDYFGQIAVVANGKKILVASIKEQIEGGKISVGFGQSSYKLAKDFIRLIDYKSYK